VPLIACGRHGLFLVVKMDSYSSSRRHTPERETVRRTDAAPPCSLVVIWCVLCTALFPRCAGPGIVAGHYSVYTCGMPRSRPRNHWGFRSTGWGLGVIPHPALCIYTQRTECPWRGDRREGKGEGAGAADGPGTHEDGAGADRLGGPLAGDRALVALRCLSGAGRGSCGHPGARAAVRPAPPLLPRPPTGHGHRRPRKPAISGQVRARRVPLPGFKSLFPLHLALDILQGCRGLFVPGGLRCNPRCNLRCNPFPE
jgi:hypothetical protein